MIIQDAAIEAIPPFMSAWAAATLALLVVARASRGVLHWAVAASLTALGLTQLGNGMSVLAQTPADLLWWRRVAVAGEMLMPVGWLVFSLTFARANWQESLRDWRMVLMLAGVATAAMLAVAGSDAVFNLVAPEAWYLRLGSAGRLYGALALIGYVLILANLEQTFRHADEEARWYIKFPVVGVGLVSVYFLYEMSDLLIYSVWHRELAWLGGIVSLVSCGLIGYGFVHRATPDVHIYVSKQVVANSLTFLLVGGVLAGTGLTAWFIQATGLPGSMVLSALFVAFAVTGLVFVLLSAQARQTLGRFVERHFFAHTYDYRTRWLEVTEMISAPGTADQIAARVATLCKSMFGARAATVWLAGDEEPSAWVRLFARSSLGEAHRLRDSGEIKRWLEAHMDPVDLAPAGGACPPGLTHEIQCTDAVLLLPLRAGDHAIGWILLGARADGTPYSHQDRDLLRCIAAQVADRLQHLVLAERLILAREMEAFYECAAFFLHDLKNFTATLSLVVQNAERHGHNPEFQRSAMVSIASTVRKMTGLMGTIAALSRDPRPKPTVLDLNALVDEVLKGFENAGGATLIRQAQPVPPVRCDPAQLHQVVLNVILNAQDAVGPEGRIVVRTEGGEAWAQVTVEDNGCGMDEDVLKSLFRPFRSTKGRGLGIGLYQCRKILQAHGGTLDVQSERNKGTRFTIRLYTDGGEGVQHG